MDHKKIILCPFMEAVTYVDEHKNFRTYRFSTLEANGCCDGLVEALQYAYLKLSHNLRNVPVTADGRR